MLGLIACQAEAQTPWFTVTGNRADPGVDTVEVDPVAIRSEGELKTMNVRVSRATERRNWDGLPYRSYESRVIFDCRARKASYIEATFYAEPLWRGTPKPVIDYSANPRPMLFRDVEPNPTQRLIRAACRVGAS
ncbi:surface-adhesin E family protein [Variovorax saccharolyticus]|uniref:surface-adhesin E family protein n=1 Tax=Variovorax saccharolyticus TaxID=3053516 RepID=UPI002578BB6D|nr:surface-adhesin E family protein [Variovorax sp. J31P216]MDM0028100.1 hypothetical protein [Variovorax sp. J31P216]